MRIDVCDWAWNVRDRLIQARLTRYQGGMSLDITTWHNPSILLHKILFFTTLLPKKYGLHFWQGQFQMHVRHDAETANWTNFDGGKRGQNRGWKTAKMGVFLIRIGQFRFRRAKNRVYFDQDESVLRKMVVLTLLRRLHVQFWSSERLQIGMCHHLGQFCVILSRERFLERKLVLLRKRGEAIHPLLAGGRSHHPFTCCCLFPCTSKKILA